MQIVRYTWVLVAKDNFPSGGWSPCVVCDVVLCVVVVVVVVLVVVREGEEGEGEKQTEPSHT